jgi:hypothetical protein
MATWSFLRTRNDQQQNHVAPLDLPADVERVSLREGLQPYLPIALDLVRTCFRVAGEPKLEVERDPETDEEWVAVSVEVRDEGDEFFERYDRYTREFLAAIPWPQCDKISLAYVLRSE